MYNVLLIQTQRLKPDEGNDWNSFIDEMKDYSSKSFKSFMHSTILHMYSSEHIFMNLYVLWFLYCIGIFCQ